LNEKPKKQCIIPSSVVPPDVPKSENETNTIVRHRDRENEKPRTLNSVNVFELAAVEK
jgi:hypothetical protein